MKLLIDIPKEFERHFKADRFEDSLYRLNADAHLLAGIYEQETALMLIEAFKKAVPVPPHGRLIDADELKKKHHWTDDFYETEYVEVEDINAAPTIIPAEEGDGE